MIFHVRQKYISKNKPEQSFFADTLFYTFKGSANTIPKLLKIPKYPEFDLWNTFYNFGFDQVQTVIYD